MAVKVSKTREAALAVSERPMGSFVLKAGACEGLIIRSARRSQMRYYGKLAQIRPAGVPDDWGILTANKKCKQSGGIVELCEGNIG